jgi:S-adenosylmethionine decarboxylase
MGKKEACNFGDHLTIDGYGGDPEKLKDKSLVLKLLDELPDLIGMKKLSKPEVYFASDNGKKDPGGWSGFVVIAESHISVHTFPGRGFVSADVYTCKSGLDCEAVIKYIVNIFQLKETETHLLKRGTKYPVKKIC